MSNENTNNEYGNCHWCNKPFKKCKTLGWRQFLCSDTCHYLYLQKVMQTSDENELEKLKFKQKDENNK